MSESQKEQMLRHVQFLALGILVEWLLTSHFASAADPVKAADDMLTRAEHISDAMTFPHADPALSDLAAQEFRDTLVRHIHRAKALATHEPFDPTAFQKRAPDAD